MRARGRHARESGPKKPRAWARPGVHGPGLIRWTTSAKHISRPRRHHRSSRHPTSIDVTVRVSPSSPGWIEMWRGKETKWTSVSSKRRSEMRSSTPAARTRSRSNAPSHGAVGESRASESWTSSSTSVRVSHPPCFGRRSKPSGERRRGSPRLLPSATSQVGRCGQGRGVTSDRRGRDDAEQRGGRGGTEAERERDG